MKTTIIKYFSWCLFICIFSSGCVDLDVSPTNKFTDDNYWTSEEKSSFTFAYGISPDEQYGMGIP